ncbi:MAG: hypothetical protein IKP23_01535 [Elusimicrobiaceae bacterium]|nr:hypothetical protein [Elusimicrobiaceae bacterium]
MPENISIEKLKGATLKDTFDFINSNQQVQELAKNLKPAEVAVRAGKDFLEIKILMTENGLKDIKK